MDSNISGKRVAEKPKEKTDKNIASQMTQMIRKLRFDPSAKLHLTGWPWGGA